jgi:hypothetical protein
VLGLGEGAPVLSRRAVAGTGALIAVAGVLAYSVPALAWLALTLAGWLALLYIAGDLTIDTTAVRTSVARHRVALIVAAVAIVAIGALSAGRIADFTDRIGDISASAGRLSSPVFPGEAFGIWPEGDFRVVRGEVSGSLLATALGVVVVAAGALVLLRRRAYAVLAALGAAGAVYVGSRAFSSIYVEAKALSILAPLVVLVGLGGLFSATGRFRSPLLALGGMAAVAIAASSFLALREAPVGFEDRGEELEQLAAKADGETVVFLGVDRFGAYWLRGTLIESPGGYVPPEIKARPEKIWQQGDPLDLDTLAPTKLDRFRYAITTTAAYQSTPPPNMEEVARTDSYVLWERRGPTPRLRVLREDGAPGRILEPSPRTCGAQGNQNSATVLPTPVVEPPGSWSQSAPFEAPGTASQTVRLRPGTWQLSLQYASQVDLTVEAAGLSSELPASLVGMYLTHQGEGSYWPVGEIQVPDGPGEVRVDVSAAEPNGIERALGAPRRVWLGRLAATRLDATRDAAPPEVSLAGACGRYVDHYVLNH